MEVFRDYAYYYNAFYREKDYRSEAETVSGLIKEYGADTETVIDLGCGTGRHDIELCKMGYRCRGIDLSPLMIEIAAKNAAQSGCDICFETADVRTYESQETYDAVISLFHVMSYQNSNRDITGAFKSARKMIKKRGVFLFDAWYGPGVLSDKPGVRVREAEDKDNRLIRIARPVMRDQDNVVEVHYEVLVIDKKTNVVSVINEVHSMRYYFKPELELMLEQAGFKLLDVLDCNTLKETDEHSWTGYFIARAK